MRGWGKILIAKAPVGGQGGSSGDQSDGAWLEVAFGRLESF